MFSSTTVEVSVASSPTTVEVSVFSPPKRRSKLYPSSNNGISLVICASKFIYPQSYFGTSRWQGSNVKLLKYEVSCSTFIPGGMNEKVENPEIISEHIYIICIILGSSHKDTWTWCTPAVFKAYSLCSNISSLNALKKYPSLTSNLWGFSQRESESLWDS